MEIFLLWHVRHATNLDGTPIVHRGEDGELVWAEDDGDDLKILGAYSTADRAQDRIERARQLPGFEDEPECFYIDRYVVDRDCWGEGFITVPDSDP